VSELRQNEELNRQNPEPESVDELEQLRRDIERQIRSNQRFLQNFLDENFSDEEE
jgi:hypothetical protein